MLINNAEMMKVMKFIRRWSYGLANNLAITLNESHEKRHLYYYGLQMIIGGIVKLTLLIAVSLMLDILLPTFAVLAFFGVLRIAAGGYHMDNYVKCMVTSFAIFIGAGFIVKYTYFLWSIKALIVFVAATFFIALFSVIKWAPADTPYKPITKINQIKLFKGVSILIVCTWLGVAMVLVINDISYYVLAGCIGIFLASFIISPIGYRFFDFISGKKKLKSQEIT